MSKLPTNIPDLLELALVDLQKCEESPYFDIEMALWWQKSRTSTLTPDGTPIEEICSVCLAGAVIANELPECLSIDCRAVGNVTNLSKLLPKETLETILFLDWVRNHVEGNLEYFPDSQNFVLAKKYGAIPEACETLRVRAPYEERPGKFKVNLRKLIKLLRKKEKEGVKLELVH
jgi:hypothetical protein